MTSSDRENVEVRMSGCESEGVDGKEKNEMGPRNEEGSLVENELEVER